MKKGQAGCLLYAADGRAARHSSETAEHYTPARIVEAARLLMGGIDLDPASSAKAQATVQATRYWTIETHREMPTHLRAWRGSVFLNPPGGCLDDTWERCRPGGARRGFFRDVDDQPAHGRVTASAKTWWRKLAREWFEGRVTQAVFVGFSLEILQSAQVDTEAGQPLPTDGHMCFPSRRIAYVRANGTVGKSPPHASVLIWLPPGGRRDPIRFGQAFADIGACLA